MYSKIKSWRIKNFRNIGDVDIDFTKSPIVTLIGENEAGKTSVVKTFSVLGCNAYQSDQKDYIRDGTTGFGICASLEDGTNIFRFKTKDINQYRIDKNNQCLFEVNKIDRGYGTPVEIEKVMGMIIEPETKELLQVRTYEDQLLFVLTKSSENYKVMYNALKVENITKAINNGNKEANEHRKAVNNYEVSIETLENTLKGIKVVNIDNAVKVKNQIKSEIDAITKIQKVINLVGRNTEINSELGILELLSKTFEIPEVLSYKLNVLESLIESEKSVRVKADRSAQVNTLSEISYEPILKLNRLIELESNLKDKTNVLGSFESLSKAQIIDYRFVTDLDRLMGLIKNATKLNSQLSIYTGIGSDISSKDLTVINNLSRIQELMSGCTNLDTSITKGKQEADSWYNKIKESGAIVTSCPNCGETVVVDASLSD